MAASARAQEQAGVEAERKLLEQLQDAEEAKQAAIEAERMARVGLGYVFPIMDHDYCSVESIPECHWGCRGGRSMQRPACLLLRKRSRLLNDLWQRPDSSWRQSETGAAVWRLSLSRQKARQLKPARLPPARGRIMRQPGKSCKMASGMLRIR